MRLDYCEFQARRVEIIALGPDGPDAFRRYWQDESIPFIGCPDIKSKVANSFHQEVNLFKLGRMPAIFVGDREGRIRYRHYGDSMADIPANAEILKIIDELEKSVS